MTYLSSHAQQQIKELFNVLNELGKAGCQTCQNCEIAIKRNKKQSNAESKVNGEQE